ncbi:MAG TPA: Mur ligase domain-containing protein [Caldisericia bacterium]|nr:Mur ligase domain-containing protein [Caldisericia bacterium]
MIEKNRVHLIGIGGVGMLSLANLLVENGCKVSGSDIIYNEKINKLEQKGVKIFLNHNHKNILDSDVIIYSSAIKPDNIELVEAKKLNKQIYHRVDFVKKFTENKKVIAVAGSHGKTTTTAMISYLFKEIGLSPSVYFGGENDDFYFGSSIGTGEYFILETDEHDESFLIFDVYLPIITNIDRDHLNIDGPFKGDFNLLKESFLKFIEKSKSKKVILSYDCPNSFELKDRITKEILSYSIENGEATIFGKIKEKVGLKTIGEIFYKHKKIGNLELSIPGDKNFLNSREGSFEIINIGDLVKDVVFDLISVAKKKNLDINFDSEKVNNSQTQSGKVIGDPWLLSLSIFNLLSNAIRYSKPDSKSIQVDLTYQVDSWILRIQDFGIGISPLDVEKILSDTPDRSPAQDTQAVHGLDFVKYVVKLHRGRFNLESKLGKGSTFTLDIPYY